jgi:hypothetical protein
MLSDDLIDLMRKVAQFDNFSGPAKKKYVMDSIELYGLDKAFISGVIDALIAVENGKLTINPTVKKCCFSYFKKKPKTTPIYKI